MKTPFVFECFDTRNTSTNQEIPLAQRVSTARVMAMKLSFKYYKVIVYKGTAWEEYEKGDKVSWSYPNGITE